MSLLYVATTNAGKVRDFQTAAAALGVVIESLPGMADMPVAPEDENTFAGNAAAKALFYSRHAGDVLVLADDSGLEVTALNDAPGVRSARYADDAGFQSRRALSPDQRNNLCLLDALARTREGDRGARYRCALAVARQGEILATAEGEVAGEILAVPRGNAGFGYDPLFLLPETGQTMGEISADERQAWSHRGRALRALLEDTSLARMLSGS